MAGRAFFADIRFTEDYVLVAVRPQFFEPLYLTGGFAFDPELSARAAEVGDLTAMNRVLESFLIHECEHENFVCMDIRRYAGNQPILVELGLKLQTFFNVLFRGSFMETAL